LPSFALDKPSRSADDVDEINIMNFFLKLALAIKAYELLDDQREEQRERQIRNEVQSALRAEQERKDDALRRLQSGKKRTEQERRDADFSRLITEQTRLKAKIMLIYEKQLILGKELDAECERVGPHGDATRLKQIGDEVTQLQYEMDIVKLDGKRLFDEAKRLGFLDMDEEFM
jgi:hypothetical protein